MAKKLPAEQDAIASPPVEATDPIATSAEAVIEDGKAAVTVGYSEGQDFRRMFDRNQVKGRDGSGPYLVLRKGVLLPDGAYADPGDSFDPEAEKVTPAALEYWLREGMVELKKQTKEFKGPMIQKG